MPNAAPRPLPRFARASGRAQDHEVPDEDIEPADATDEDTGAGRASPRLLRRLKEIDDARPGLPGEHLAVLALGAWLMLAGMRGRTPLRRVLYTLAGTALVGRAASGTGGIARVARILKRLG
ncbi:hypothetical protein [Achromobacter pulmonis]|uniref:hypothetical protein n=1 Tax=Achromobacter pulmonis TaxID=1389932 RepID=UPI002159CF7F|nr:hypothetical protein [Achromobacter pulmonis]